MLDKNGTEIRTGDMVQITGAYFKNDNGLYFVEHSPGDVAWCGNDYSLRKISKRGKISTAKGRICFWPIAIFTNSYEKRVNGNAWNKEHAEIEIVGGVPVHEVVEHFTQKAKEAGEQAKWMAWNFGEEHQEVKLHLDIKAQCEEVVQYLKEM
jgi:acylphosphatase